MEKRVVILFEVHPVVTYARRYDFQTLLDHGYQIDVCDLSKVISEFHSVGRSEIEDKAGIHNYCFQSRKEFQDYIKKLDKNTFIWSTFQLTAEYIWVFRVIASHLYGFICNVDYVCPRSAARMAKKSYWTNWSWHRVKNAVLFRIPKKSLFIRMADAVITYGAGDEKRKLQNILYDKYTVVELTNTIDYNECIRVLSHTCEGDMSDLPEDYIVFIDEYLPYHPDGLKAGIHIDADRYYREVESFLHRISDQMHMPVVIAAHPKADYALHAECYRGMKIIQFKTNELLYRARLVVTHLSTAISMVMVYRKPFIVFTTNDVKHKLYAGGIEESQKRDLKCNIVNISLQLSDQDIYKEIKRAQGISREYFDEQILKYKLPEGHPNEALSFGEILLKAMKRVRKRNKRVENVHRNKDEKKCCMVRK